MRLCYLYQFIALCLLQLSAFADSGGGYKIIDRIPGPDGPWSYAAIDPEGRTLFVARGDVIMSVDLAKKTTTPVLLSGSRVRSILPLAGTDLAISANAGSGTAVIFNRSTGVSVKTLRVGEKPHALVRDPKSGLIVVFNEESHDAALLDMNSQTVVSTIKLDGEPETGAADGEGLVYANLEDKAEIAVIDIASHQAVKYFSLTGCKGPTGLALDRKMSLLISVCANEVAKVIDAKTGDEVASLPIGKGANTVILDEARRTAYVPNGFDGTLTVISLTDDGRARVTATAGTQLGTRSGALDPETGILYLPAARFTPAQPGGSRREPITGTFEVLVLASAPNI